MDESEYYLREFVKSRNESQVTKLKLKKVVGDIILAQKVRRFLVKIQPAWQQGTRKTSTTEIMRRHSVRLISPKGVRASKRKDSIRNVDGRPVVGKQAEAPHRASFPATSGIPGPPLDPHPKLELVGDSSRNRNSKSSLNDEYVRCASDHGGASRKSSVHKMPHIVNKSEVNTGNVGKRPRVGLDVSGSTKGMDNKRGTALPALPDAMWAGDPKAIGSIRRPRKNPKEMSAAYKSGEDSRRLIREMTFPCTRNCHKPNLMIELDRIYLELPTIVPAIVKARRQIGKSSSPASDRPRVSLLSLLSPASVTQPSSLVNQLSQERRSSIKLQSPTVRLHGPDLRQISTALALGVRHKL